jgi:hypothetical protein
MAHLWSAAIDGGFHAPIAAGAARLCCSDSADDRQGILRRHGRPDGIFRALSFIGLGAVLVGIGWLYQRMLFPVSGERYNLARSRLEEAAMDKRTRSYGVVAPDVLKSFDGLGFLRGIRQRNGS